MEQQILDTLNQYISQNPGYKLNEKALEQIHASAKSYDRLVNDLHYLMKIEISSEKSLHRPAHDRAGKLDQHLHLLQRGHCGSEKIKRRSYAMKKQYREKSALSQNSKIS